MIHLDLKFMLVDQITLQLTERSVRLVSSPFGELNQEWILPVAAGRKIHIVTATPSRVFFSLIIFHVLEMPSLKNDGAIHIPMFTFHKFVKFLFFDHFQFIRFNGRKLRNVCGKWVCV